MSYELFSLLSDKLTREDRREVCSGVWAALRRLRQAMPQSGLVPDDLYIEWADADEFCLVPPEPEKPLSTTAICSKCGHVFTNGDNATVAHGVFTCLPTCPLKQEAEGLDEILGGIQTDECNQYMHNDAKRRIVEAIVKIIDSRRHHEDAKQAVRDWGLK